MAGGKDIPHCCAKSPAKIQLFFFCFSFHRTPCPSATAATGCSQFHFLALADWSRCVAASQSRYPTIHRRITNPTEYTSIRPVQASNPSSIHPWFDQLPHTAHVPASLHPCLRFPRGLSLLHFFSAPIYYFRVYCTSPGNRVSIASARPVTSIMFLFFLFSCVFTSLRRRTPEVKMTR